MSDYKDLQDKAKALGLKYVGVSGKELKKSIKEAEETPRNTDVEKMATPAKKDADAVVYQGKRKVRVYTLEQHGKEYVKMAKQFISHPEREDYRVEFETVETRLTCPHCGKKFRYN